jgi:hypothetical protein
MIAAVEVAVCRVKDLDYKSQVEDIKVIISKLWDQAAMAFVSNGRRCLFQVFTLTGVIGSGTCGYHGSARDYAFVQTRACKLVLSPDRVSSVAPSIPRDSRWQNISQSPYSRVPCAQSIDHDNRTLKLSRPTP